MRTILEEPVLAHSFGEAGPDIELFIFGIACLILAIVFFFQKNVKRQVPPFLVVVAGLMMTAAVVLGGGEDEPEPSARPAGLSVDIISPTDGGVIAAGEEVDVEVEIEGGTLVAETASDDPTAGHLHIFVDGALFSMPTSASPSVEFEPGAHELTVEFTRADHGSFEPRVLDEIEIEAR